MTNVLKSVVLSLAVLDRHVTVEDSVSLSRLEQEYQVIDATVLFKIVFVEEMRTT